MLWSYTIFGMTQPRDWTQVTKNIVEHSAHLLLIEAPLKFLFSYVVKLHHIFGMTRPVIEPGSPRPLSNTLPTYH